MQHNQNGMSSILKKNKSRSLFSVCQAGFKITKHYFFFTIINSTTVSEKNELAKWSQPEQKEGKYFGQTKYPILFSIQPLQTGHVHKVFSTKQKENDMTNLSLIQKKKTIIDTVREINISLFFFKLRNVGISSC